MKNKLLVTGAAGFLGGRAAKHFAADSAYEVLATSRRSERKAELEQATCQFMAGDLCEAGFCEQLLQGVDVVIHCAALSSPYGLYEDFYRSNVLATQNLLEASLKNGVKQFIFISTPSIYFNYSDRFEVREADPLPAKMVNAYAETKLRAEKMVLAQDQSRLKTLALRPRAIIGAEDTVIFPRVLEAYRQGRLKIIGDGQNVCDLTSVRNVIEAIDCAMSASDSAYGEAYNITDGASVKFWEAVNYALSGLGYTPVQKKVSRHLANLAARILEGKAKLFAEKKEPVLTRYGVGILYHNFTLNIDKAKTKLNYQPKMSSMEGINEYIAWHKRQH